MEFDFEKLASSIEDATRSAFIELVAKHKQEQIYAFALYSDEGAMTVCPSANTIEYLQTKPERDQIYYKYEPAEWKYEAKGAEQAFSSICSMLYDEVEDEKYEEDQDEVLFGVFQSSLYEVCIAVLDKLKREGFFKAVLGYDVFLMFSVTDYEMDKEELAAMISLLNEEPYLSEYLNWMKTWKK